MAHQTGTFGLAINDTVLFDNHLYAVDTIWGDGELDLVDNDGNVVTAHVNDVDYIAFDGC